MKKVLQIQIADWEWSLAYTSHLDIEKIQVCMGQHFTADYSNSLSIRDTNSSFVTLFSNANKED